MAQVSINIDYNEAPDNGYDTDECESSYTAFEFLTKNGMVKIDIEKAQAVRDYFLLGMGSLAKDTTIVAIHKNSFSSLTAIARARSFKVFSEEVASKCGGNANVRSAWYGASKKEIHEILNYGFCRPEEGKNYGIGLHLVPLKFSLDGVLSSEMDEYGLRHVFLCGVILGKMEVVPASSKQICPSSKEFDSGVDNIADPRRYIMWSCNMNSHISLLYVLSFKLPLGEAFRSLIRSQLNAIAPTSRSDNSYNILMALLSRYSHPSKRLLFVKHLNDYKNRRITANQLSENWSHLAGKRLSNAIYTLYKKEVQMESLYDDVGVQWEVAVAGPQA